MQISMLKQKDQIKFPHECTGQMITVSVVSCHRLRPSIVCGMVNVGNLKQCLERSTTATTLVLLAHCPLRVMTFSQYCSPLKDTCSFQLCCKFCTVEKFKQSDILRLVFACRSFVLDMTTETEASAVISTSCKPSKPVYSCPFSSCLGMHHSSYCLMKQMT